MSSVFSLYRRAKIERVYIVQHSLKKDLDELIESNIEILSLVSW